MLLDIIIWYTHTFFIYIYIHMDKCDNTDQPASTRCEMVDKPKAKQRLAFIVPSLDLTGADRNTANNGEISLQHLEFLMSQTLFSGVITVTSTVIALYCGTR